jgi:hypothetical protein
VLSPAERIVTPFGISTVRRAVALTAGAFEVPLSAAGVALAQALPTTVELGDVALAATAVNAPSTAAAAVGEKRTVRV